MKLGPYELGPNDTPENGIYTGDARELSKAIPDESVDLIFTDPIYQNIDDYRWLAETGARVLKEDRACLVWIANPRMLEVGAAMSRFLEFVMPLVYTVRGKGYLMFSRRMFLWTTLCLWFDKGHFLPHSVIPDTALGNGKRATTFKWNKNPGVMCKWIDAFSEPDALTLDPFTGGGTVPAVCKMLGRKWLAFEIDPATAEMARERVRMTQPPLFVPESVQDEMGL